MLKYTNAQKQMHKCTNAPRLKYTKKTKCSNAQMQNTSTQILKCAYANANAHMLKCSNTQITQMLQCSNTQLLKWSNPGYTDAQMHEYTKCSNAQMHKTLKYTNNTNNTSAKPTQLHYTTSLPPYVPVTSQEWASMAGPGLQAFHCRDPWWCRRQSGIATGTSHAARFCRRGYQEFWSWRSQTPINGRQQTNAYIYGWYIWHKQNKKKNETRNANGRQQTNALHWHSFVFKLSLSLSGAKPTFIQILNAIPISNSKSKSSLPTLSLTSGDAISDWYWHLALA